MTLPVPKIQILIFCAAVFWQDTIQPATTRILTEKN